MQALRKTRAAPGLSLLQVAPPPAPGPGEVTVRVSATGVCGTDLHIDAWTPSYEFVAPSLPVTVGHEFSGHVAACGAGVTALQPGELVAVRPSVVCGRCEACMADRHDDCVTRRGIGVTRDGAFAGLVNVPARNCVPVPPDVDPVVAALAEPLTVSHEAVRTAGVAPGDRVLVVGPGNIGQGIALFARAAGAGQVVVAGRGDAARLQVLRTMGFDDLVDLEEPGAQDRLAALAGAGFDAVIEAAGAASAVELGHRLLKPRGVLVIGGIHARPVPLDLTLLVRRQQQVRGSYRAPESAWPRVVDFMRRHQDTLRLMVTHRVALEQAAEGFALARERQATKVMVLPRPAVHA